MTREAVNESDLRNAVELYQVGFRISPDQVEIRGRIVEVTFHLELSGNHEGHRGTTEAPCRTCVRVLNTLFDIADVLLPLEREALRRIDRNCERYLHYRCDNNEPGGVLLAIDIKARRVFEQANDGWAMDFWRKVSRLLLDHGCRERPAAEKATEAASIYQASRSSLERVSRVDYLLTPVA